MQPGIFAKTFAGSDPETVLDAAKAAGFGTVQWNMACSGLGSLPSAIPAEAAARVAAASRQSGVTLAAVSATYNMIHPDPAERLAGRAAFEAIAGAARAMGTGLVTLCTGSLNAADQWAPHPDNGSPDAWAMLLEEFRAILPVADAQDLTLGIEPEMANVVDSARTARRLIETLGSPRIRIVLDPANLFEAEDADLADRIVREAVDLLGPAIALAHAKDRALDGSVVAAGRGCIDFAAFRAALAARGYDGPLVAHGCTADEAPGVAGFLRSLEADDGA